MSPREGRHILHLLDDIELAIAELREAEVALAGSAEGTDPPRVPFNAILYCLVVIGEAVNALPDEVRESQPVVPRQRIVGMRNLLTHEYFRVETETVMRTLDAPLVDLQAACDRIRAAVAGETT